MSDNHSHKSHKRQKSSASNINYYFPPPGQDPQDIHTIQQQQQQHQDQSHPQLSIHSSPSHLASVHLPTQHQSHHLSSSPDHYHQNESQQHQQQQQQQHSLHASIHTPIQDPYTTAQSHTAYSFPPHDSSSAAAQVPINAVGSGGPGSGPGPVTGTSGVALDPSSVQSSPTFTQYPQQFIFPSVESSYSMHPPSSTALHAASEPTTGGGLTGSNTDASSLHPFNFPKHPVSSQDLYYPTSPIATKVSPSKQRLQQHSKNNLSISSHFNLFNLKEEYEPGMRQQQLQQQTPSHAHTHSQSSQPQLQLPQIGAQRLTHQSTPSHSHIPTGVELLPPAQLYPAIPSYSLPAKADIVQSLLIQLPNIDGQNINSFLLDIIHKISNQLPLDEFYNILYNTDDNDSQTVEQQHQQQQQQRIQNNLDKIDNTIFATPTVTSSSTYTISSVLGVFKNPMTLNNFISNIDTSQIKLTSVNYHELLRTFLAIKILSDVLVQLPEPTVELEHTIPRLSIYKTYYIVCQKLISNYPSSSNTVSEQQKIILGQSKLGKLIKLVYPNLRIKRLGSRGESKYNYLGVVWNENIIHQDIRDLCENNELSDLSTYFMSRKVRIAKSSHGGKRKASSQLQGAGSQDLSVGMGIGMNLGDLPVDVSENPNFDSSGLAKSSSTRPKAKSKRSQTNTTSSGSRKEESYAFAPQLSFTNPFLKFPTFEDFSILQDLNKENWFESVSKEQTSIVDGIISGNSNEDTESIINLIQDVFVNDLIEVDGDISIVSSFLERVVNPYAAAALSNPETFSNIDLRIYLIIIVKLLPYLLLLSNESVRGFDNQGSFLQTLRSNLIQFVNNYTDSLIGFESVFPHTNATIFCIILKKLINVNDLLITFIKLIMKEEDFSSTRSSMKSDIQNYLISPSPSLSFENNEIRFNFKEDIVQNDLIFSLMGYNYNPSVNDENMHHQLQPSGTGPATSSITSKTPVAGSGQGASGAIPGGEKPSSVVSMKFVREEATLIEQFFKVDLVKFLSMKFDNIDTELVQQQRSDWANLLSDQEFSTLTSLIRLMHESLLSTHFKSRYPILVYHNFISCILNDLLKHIYSKQQIQSQLQSQSSFGNWWVFNSFVEEYVGLMGEIVGVYQSI